MLTILKYFGLAFTALLPVVNPVGSALVFLGIVGVAPAEEYRKLARKIAISTVLFFLVIEGVGATLLAFFGISLPVVQLAGGLVLAAMGWGLLNQSDGAAQSGHAAVSPSYGGVEQKIFYPLTFPITAGPACIVVMLTLSAHASSNVLLKSALAHSGIALSVVAISYTVYLCYTYAPKLTLKISPSTVQGILRVIAFVLLCIGVQIAWKGLEGLIQSMPK